MSSCNKLVVMSTAWIMNNDNISQSVIKPYEIIKNSLKFSAFKIINCYTNYPVPLNTSK